MSLASAIVAWPSMQDMVEANCGAVALHASSLGQNEGVAPSPAVHRSRCGALVPCTMVEGCVLMDTLEHELAAGFRVAS